MTSPPTDPSRHPRLPDGFVVRLHDDVEVGTHLVAGTRVLRLAPAALDLLIERSVAVDSPLTAALAARLLDLDLADPDLTGETARLGDLTVVVPVQDNPSGVDQLLGGLDGLRCIVVDDASGDAGALAGVVARHGAELVRLDHNVGPAAARNVGLRLVSTALVAFIDSDVTITSAALAALTVQLVDPSLAAVAPRVRTTADGLWFQRYEAACGSLDLGPVAATVRARSAVTYVPSACLVARTDLLGSGFDVRLRSGEDVDLVWRLQAEGYRVRYAAEVEALHAPRPSVRAWLARKVVYGTSASDLSARHPGRVAPAVLTPAVAVATVGILLQRRWSVAVAVVAAGSFVRETDPASTDLSLRRRSAVVRASGGVMVAQVSSLVLRHWWPLSAVLSLGSARARRAVVAIAVLDGLMTHRGTATGAASDPASAAALDPWRFTAARRVDDLAYGAGVWCGAARRRSIACLLPQWVVPRIDRGSNR